MSSRITFGFTMNASIFSENSKLMSVDQPAIVNGCRWAWCRLTFPDGDALLNHVIHEHVRRAIPVRRRDIPFLTRTEEGLGESLGLSDVMRDPSSSVEKSSKGTVLSSQSQDAYDTSQQPPPSTSLPSPPASSPQLPQRHTDGEDEPQPSPTGSADENPTFASLSSPAESLDSLQIPESPSFSSLVQRQPYKRKYSHLAAEAGQNKRPRQLSPVQGDASPASTSSQHSVEDHLTQTSLYSDKDVDDAIEDGHSSSGSADARGEVDPDEYQMGRSSRGDPTWVPNTPSALNGSELDLYEGELKWDSQPATQLTESQEEEDGPVQHLETLTQPPSQLQLSSSSSHLHPIQTDPDTNNLSLPLSSPALLPSPPDFAISTPQRQNWYQPSSLLRKASGNGSSRVASTETTPKPSRRHELPAIPSTIEEEGSRLQVSSPQPRAQSPMATAPRTPQRRQQPSALATPIRPIVTPLSNRTGFRSGKLQIAHPPGTPVPRFQQQVSPTKIVYPATTAVNNANANKVTDSDTNAPALIRGVFAVQEESLGGDSQSQSQFDHSMQFSQEYPQLQTQAPYQSQSSYSQLD